MRDAPLGAGSDPVGGAGPVLPGRVNASTVGVAIGFGALGLLLVLRGLLPDVFVPPVVAVIPPLVVASFASSVVTAAVAVAAVLSGALLLVLEGSSWRSWLVELTVTAIATAVSVFLADRRERREDELAALRSDDALAADRRAARSAQLLASVADGVDDAIFVKDSTGRYLFANGAAARLLGGAPEHVVGRRDGDLLAAPLAAALGEHDRQVLETGQSQLFEESGPWAPGSGVFSTTKAPYRDADGSVIGVIGVGRDITARVAAEARARVVQELAVRLAATLTTAEVAEAVLEVSSTVAPAHAACLALIDAEAGALRVLGTRGAPFASLGADEAIPLDSPAVPAQVARTGTPLAASDAAGACSERWLPVVGARGVAGVLGHAYAEPLSPGDVDHELLEAIARRCGHALERAVLHEAEAHQRHRAELGSVRATQLAELTRAFGAASDVAELVDAMLDSGLHVLNATHGAVYELDPGRAVLSILGVRSEGGEHLAPVIALDAPVGLARVARSGQPLLARDDPGAGDDLAGWAVVPLIAYGAMKGVLALRPAEPAPEAEPEHDADERRFWASVGARCGEALERTQLHAAERQARMEAQRRAATLTDLQRVTTELSRSLTSVEVAATVLDALAWRLGGPGALLTLASEDGTVSVLGARNVAGVAPGDTVDAVGIARLGGVPLELVDPWELRHRIPGIGTVLADAGYAAATVRPLRGRRGVTGVLALGWTQRPELDAATSRYIETLATLAGQALERAGSFDDEHAIADAVQRSLLPRLPATIGDISLVGRFSPGSRRVLVGGDWFDAFDLGDGAVALCVGDVEGRGISAATCMGQVRASLHALATSVDDPGALVARLRWSPDLVAGPMVTLALVVVVGGELRYVHAGHPPSLLRHREGTIEVLGGGRAVPLGVGLASLDRSARTPLPAGATLVMYTDGLIERRGETLDDGMARLTAALDDGPDDLDALADHLLARCVQRAGEDDVCLLLARC